MSPWVIATLLGLGYAGLDLGKGAIQGHYTLKGGKQQAAMQRMMMEADKQGLAESKNSSDAMLQMLMYLNTQDKGQQREEADMDRVMMMIMSQMGQGGQDAMLRGSTPQLPRGATPGSIASMFYR